MKNPSALRTSVAALLLPLALLPAHAEARDSGDSMVVMGLCNYGPDADKPLDFRFPPVRFADEVSYAVAGANHILFIADDGDLYAAGENSNGQLGDGTEDYRSEPVLIDRFVRKAWTGANYSLFVTFEDVLYGMGQNDGQLGDGTVADRVSPVKIFENVRMAAAAEDHSLFVTTGDVLYGMGSNESGKLGLSTDTANGGIESTLVPVKIAENVVFAAAADDHSFFITTEGDLYGMGWNNNGVLGVVLGVDGHGNEIESTSTPVKVASNVEFVVTSSMNTLFITTDGDLYGMGFNGNGELGGQEHHPTPYMIASNVSNAAMGSWHSLYLDNEGDLYAMGYNTFGQLGLRPSGVNTTPVKIAEEVRAVSAGGAFSLYLTPRHNSAYWPCWDLGAKWDDTMGWIDDTYFPWVWSYTGGNWYYLYDELGARTAYDGHWIFYYTSDLSDYGWGYVWPGYGWYCFAQDMSWQWLDLGEAMPR